MTETELEAIEERVKFYRHEVLDMWDSDEVLGYITSLMADNGSQHNEIIQLKVQLRQAQEAVEVVRKEEREACLEIVRNFQPRPLTDYYRGAATRLKEGIETEIENRKYLPR